MKLLICLMLCCLAWNVHATEESHWVGTIQTKERSAPIRIDLQQKDSALTGTVFAPSEQLILARISDAKQDAETISFTVNGAQFRASISGKTMTGSLRAGDSELPVTLVLLAPVTNSRYFGIYSISKNKNIYIRTWDELGPDQLTYFDDDGNAGALYAISEDSFIAGPSLILALPKTADLTFQFDKTGNAVALKWKEASGQQKIASKVTDIHEESIRFQNGDIHLAGSLVMPAGEGPHRAVVLVHGSGPVTRDFFGPIGYVLASHGIAVLSYDKRGIGESGGDWLEATFDDLANDALAGIQYLKSRKEIQPAQIGLLGISQGGWIIPLAASKSSDVAYAVLVSAPAVSPAKQDESRVREEMILTGASQEEIHKKMAGYKEQIDGLMSEEGLKWVEDEIRKAKEAHNDQLLSSGEPDNPRFLLWLRSILNYDPLPALAKVKCPVLAIYGELDRGVPVRENKEILENTIQQSGNNNVRVVIFPAADHALLECKTGSASEFPYLKRFVPGFFDTAIQWILQRKL
jgi:pimeloyl-ACP methyl ester carboxylesterase